MSRHRLGAAAGRSPGPSTPSEPRYCNRPGCVARIILAKIVPSGRWLPFEAADQLPFSDAALGCHVLLNNEAWRPRDLIEDFQVRFETTEDKARELLHGYPWHRMHRCDSTGPDLFAAAGDYSCVITGEGWDQ